MVKVGVVGPGALWETRYRPALERLAGRIGVCAVYDPVASRAELVAAEMKATPVQGMLALAELPAVQAVLLIDPGFAGRFSLPLLARVGKPIYIAGALGNDVDLLSRLRQRASSHHLTLMPEFTLRHTPTTARLQELMATKLGRPSKIVLNATWPHPGDAHAAITGAGADFLVGLFDWCRYVVRTPPVLVRAFETRGAAVPPSVAQGSTPSALPAERCIQLEFARSRSGGEAAKVELRLHTPIENNSAAPVAAASPAIVESQVICELGQALIKSSTEIHWQNGAGEPTIEALTADRSSVEVMLDHFCRRVVGGLIPIADLGDVCRGLVMARAVEECLRTGQSVGLGDEC